MIKVVRTLWSGRGFAIDVAAKDLSAYLVRTQTVELRGQRDLLEQAVMGFE